MNPKVNKRQIRSDFSRAAKTYNDAAIVQAEICTRALERLQMLRLQPERILDVGSGTGKSVFALEDLFPNAQVIACDLALPMLRQSRYEPALCCDAQYLPIKNASVDLIFSTSTFQWCDDLNLLFAECMRVLKKEGALVFSTFGPDTLKELRLSWAQVDQHSHVHQFIDMHHIGDYLLAHQYYDPVVDRETIVIEYQTLGQLLKDLKATGSRAKFVSSDESIPQGLMGKQKFQRLLDAYNEHRLENGALPASYEVIYGYARKIDTLPKKSDPGVVKVPVDSIGR